MVYTSKRNDIIGIRASIVDSFVRVHQRETQSVQRTKQVKQGEKVVAGTQECLESTILQSSTWTRLNLSCLSAENVKVCLAVASSLGTRANAVHHTVFKVASPLFTACLDAMPADSNALRSHRVQATKATKQLTGPIISSGLAVCASFPPSPLATTTRCPRHASSRLKTKTRETSLLLLPMTLLK